MTDWAMQYFAMLCHDGIDFGIFNCAGRTSPSINKIIDIEYRMEQFSGGVREAKVVGIGNYGKHTLDT